MNGETISDQEREREKERKRDRENTHTESTFFPRCPKLPTKGHNLVREIVPLSHATRICWLYVTCVNRCPCYPGLLLPALYTSCATHARIVLPAPGWWGFLTDLLGWAHTLTHKPTITMRKKHAHTLAQLRRLALGGVIRNKIMKGATINVITLQQPREMDEASERTIPPRNLATRLR